VKLSSAPTDHGTGHGSGVPQSAPDLRMLFHRLNNQLGIILAHAELLEAKAPDEAARARAAQVVTSVLDAMGTAREIRRKTEPGDV
jgi:nitrogen-specific signal transduction histidine kinase